MKLFDFARGYFCHYVVRGDTGRISLVDTFDLLKIPSDSSVTKLQGYLNLKIYNLIEGNRHIEIFITKKGQSNVIETHILDYTGDILYEGPSHIMQFNVLFEPKDLAAGEYSIILRIDNDQTEEIERIYVTKE
jgi:hypothetical protein